MPIGCTSIVPRLIQDLEDTESLNAGCRVLDLGIGFGLWGAAVRQWIDRGVKPYLTYLMGVEGFDSYRSAAWDLYDYVHVMTIQEWLAWDETRTDKFHLILLLDVLEHFPKDEGKSVLSRIKSHLLPLGRLYVGTPATWQEQGAAWGNELERHRSLWDASELEAEGFSILEDGVTANPYGHFTLLGVHVAG